MVKIMNIYDSKIWIEDINTVLAALPELSRLEGKRILITGVTGLICSALVDIIIEYNESNEGKIQLYALGRNEKKIRNRFGCFFSKDYFNFVPYDSTVTDNQFPDYVDFIVHGAANSSPKKIINEPVETMLGNFLGVKYLLDYARNKRVKRLLYISSSEVYGKKERVGAAKENDYGFIDILVPRNSYSVGKKAAETLCISYTNEYDIDTVIVRPGHIYGPTANKADDHVSSAWAYDAANGRDIVMKSDGSQIRSYVYCLDCASAIVKVLLDGAKGKAYNISNPESIISIKEMAELLSNSTGVKLKLEVPDIKEKSGFNPMSNSSLDSSNLIELGWSGCFNAEIGFEHTTKILKEILDTEKTKQSAY